MSALHPAYVILVTALAILVSFILSRKQVTHLHVGRFNSIDGLRGFLAFFVFLHHAAIWYFYSRTGVWRVPESNLYTQLGEASVSLFFMITSFLFYTKLLESRRKSFDWPAFFLSRFLRLAPLYFFAMLILFLIIAILSTGDLHDSTLYVTRCMLQWLSFTIFGDPDINQIHTKIVVAGVTWSLPYEWFFYFALPLLAMTTGVRAGWPFVLLSVATLAFAATRGLSLYFVYVFMGGIAASLLARHEGFKRFSATRSASILVVISILALLMFPTAYGIKQLILLTTAFSLIAGGTDIFGTLSCATSRRFGDLAYSIYLLHGAMLFVAINFVVGIGLIRSMTPIVYWLFIASLVPVLLGVCFLTFRFIEKPGMQLTPRVLGLWRRAPDPAAI
jgi:peptidoglycan/LPS O-acetylase OafA/YrhL